MVSFFLNVMPLSLFAHTAPSFAPSYGISRAFTIGMYLNMGSDIS